MKVKDYYDYLMATDSLDKIDKNIREQLEDFYNEDVDTEYLDIDISPILFEEEEDEEDDYAIDLDDDEDEDEVDDDFDDEEEYDEENDDFDSEEDF